MRPEVGTQAQFKKKKAYDRTAEIGIYLHPDFCGKGLGKPIVAFLENEAREIGFKVLIASISGENTTSIRLFENCGYRACAHYHQVGEKFSRLLDVLDYEKIF